MFERTQSFDMNGREHTGIQIKIENILHKELRFSTNSIKLGKSLLRITYFDEKMDKEKQKNNRITILQEPEKRVYVQIKGQLNDDQVEKIWQELGKELEVSEIVEVKKETTPTKDKLIENIIESIKLKGYSIDNADAREFIESFQEKYDRLPIDQEINSIVKGYIIMKNEDHLLKQSETTIEYKEPVIERGETTTYTDSYNSSTLNTVESVGRRTCPSCGDHTSIHEVIDKNLVLMDYPRIYGKKKYCGSCGLEWH
ncbi:MAG: hypothetical protein ACW98D_16210 [Promethearchaeota archaeon]|jgi:hypothetical protein